VLDWSKYRICGINLLKIGICRQKAALRLRASITGHATVPDTGFGIENNRVVQKLQFLNNFLLKIFYKGEKL
jgi:hypothetical protein